MLVQGSTALRSILVQYEIRYRLTRYYWKLSSITLAGHFTRGFYVSRKPSKYKSLCYISWIWLASATGACKKKAHARRSIQVIHLSLTPVFVCMSNLPSRGSMYVNSDDYDCETTLHIIYHYNRTTPLHVCVQ